MEHDRESNYTLEEHPNFNRVQFETVNNEAGLNRFEMTPTKWVKITNYEVILKEFFQSL